MTKNSNTSSVGVPRRFSLWSWLLLALPTALLALTVFLSLQSLGTQYNLYYILWKTGLRSYEPQVALSGIFHDHSYRDHFLGMSQAEFESHFPATFHRVVRQPPIARDGDLYFVSDYRQARDETGAFGMCWMAVFRDDRLIEFTFAKA